MMSHFGLKNAVSGFLLVFDSRFSIVFDSLLIPGVLKQHKSKSSKNPDFVLHCVHRIECHDVQMWQFSTLTKNFKHGKGTWLP